MPAPACGQHAVAPRGRVGTRLAGETAGGLLLAPSFQALLASGPSMAEETKSRGKLLFHFIKSQGFRAIHVDGAIGGLTPGGLIHLACYAERAAIPQLIVHDVDEHGRLGDKIDEVTRGGIVRELQADLFMDLQTARSLHELLGKALSSWDEASSKKEETGDRR